VAVKRLVQGKGGIGVNERPSNKLDVVKCVDCHRRVTERKKEAFDEMKNRCVGCHDQSYAELLVQWKRTSEALIRKVSLKIKQVRDEIEAIERRGGHTFAYRKLLGEAEVNYDLAKKGNGVHNLEYAEELLEIANNLLDEAIATKLARKK